MKKGKPILTILSPHCFSKVATLIYFTKDGHREKAAIGKKGKKSSGSHHMRRTVLARTMARLDYNILVDILRLTQR